MAGLVSLHVSDEPQDVYRALAAAQHITDSQPMRVQIIVNGPAVTGLKDVDARDGVSIFACERAMRTHELLAEDLAPGVATVPSAAIALANAQHEGAAYIRI